MPDAGWCRECGEWVWLDEGGGCQHGHGAECVDEPYSAAASPLGPDELAPEPPRGARATPTDGDDGAGNDESANGPATTPAIDRPFGRGELPDDVYRFNWGAFLLPFFWGVAYGVWQLVMLWALALLVPLLAGLALGSGMTAVIGAAVISEATSGLVRLWAGANANRALWRRESTRLERFAGAKARFDVARFLARQRWWATLGWVVVLVGSALLVPLTIDQWRGYGLGVIGTAMPFVWLGAEALLGLWLARQMRAEGTPRVDTGNREG